MSGFAGIVNLDGAPVQRELIERMTRSLAFRGPDAQEIWCGENVGLGHAMFRATDESLHERQPFQSESGSWIVADARVDARAELVSKLNFASPNRSPFSLATPDSELILGAYLRWGEECLDHLLGDFSFAIWDARNKRLFCARDHFGIRPFHYARIGTSLIFSNTLEVLRLHPGVSSRLNDLAIGDFLISGCYWRPELSTFEDIRKLPPAHCLSAGGEIFNLRRYWTLPIEEPLRLRHSEYIEQFHFLLGEAVADRVRTSRVTVSMSGGLDSSSVAALAASQLRGKGSLHAITMVFDRVIPDQERKYATLVANYLQIPIEIQVGDDYPLFSRCDSGEFHFPEPSQYETAASESDFYRRAPEHGHVLLTGEAGDVGLEPSLRFFRGKRVPEFMWQMAKYVLTHGKHPALGFHLEWLRWRAQPLHRVADFPDWIEPGFADRLNLRRRWQELNVESASAHPDRPMAYSSYSLSAWPDIFEKYDSAYTRVPLQARHPFFDLRVVRFLLRLPTLPWCADKELLRVAMAGKLPPEILKRPKAPLAGDPLVGLLREMDPRSLLIGVPSPGLEKYIVKEKIPHMGGDFVPSDPEVHLRALSLNYWLQSFA